MPSITFEARIVLAGSVGVRVYGCSTKSENFEMYSCMGKSVCLNVVNLDLAIVEFPHSENLSCKRGFIAGQFYLMNAAPSHIYGSDPLAVAKATISRSLQEKTKSC